MGNGGASHWSVGARGWNHAAWLGVFYPEDLPSDWRLSYYANEFPVVMVPETDWADGEDLSSLGWADDVPDLFRFFLEIELTAAVDQVQRRLVERAVDALGTTLGGLMIKGASRAKPEQIRAVLGDFPAPPALYFSDPRSRSFEPGPGGPSMFRTVAEGTGVACVAAVGGGRSRSLSGLRAEIELLARDSAGDEVGVVFLTGDPPDPELLRGTRTLVDLMIP